MANRSSEVMSQLSTHILDLGRGKPAQGVLLKLFEFNSNSWTQVGQDARTDVNGRFENFNIRISSGTFKIRFETKDYFNGLGISETLYPFIEVSYKVLKQIDIDSNYFTDNF